jgi:cellulose 1,4-beta-cellobiosidase
MLACLLGFTLSVNPGSEETRPKLTFQKCTRAGCTPQSGSVVIDQEWRTVTDASGKNCLKPTTGQIEWDETVCKGEQECATKCQLNGFDYKKASVSTSGSTVRLGFLNPDNSVGSRVYLFDETAGSYFNFKMINHEVTFDIETSTLGCGTNGAAYFSDMLPDGGSSKYPLNKAGAKYGTGYCDAQCPRDGRFIGNYANIGKKYGSCCYEWDLWEANAYATQWAAHACSVRESAYVCTNDCQQCDTAGCCFNPYRDPGSGKLTDFYGKAKKIDTTKKFTVITQFISTDGSDAGGLKEVRRLWVQGGKVIETPAKSAWNGSANVPYSNIGDVYCKSNLGQQAYAQRGGDAGFTLAFQRGAVLCMSLWTDGSMSWLDEGMSGPCTSPGGEAGVKAANRNSYLEISNIRYGPLDTTY